MSEIKLTAAAKRTLEKYGVEKCLVAYHANEVVGNGPSTIAFDYGFASWHEANNAINAGRWLQHDPSSPV